MNRSLLIWPGHWQLWLRILSIFDLREPATLYFPLLITVALCSRLSTVVAPAQAAFLQQ